MNFLMMCGKNVLHKTIKLDECHETNHQCNNFLYFKICGTSEAVD
jgi:hypothetical protein